VSKKVFAVLDSISILAVVVSRAGVLYWNGRDSFLDESGRLWRSTYPVT